MWTVDEAEDVELCLELGVDAIITNRPAAVRAQVGRGANGMSTVESSVDVTRSAGVDCAMTGHHDGEDAIETSVDPGRGRSPGRSGRTTPRR